MAHTQWQGYGGTGTELYEHGEDGEVPHLELEPRDRARGATAGSSSTPLPDAPAAAAQGARSDAPLRRRRRCPWQEILFSRCACARWPFPVSPLRVCGACRPCRASRVLTLDWAGRPKEAHIE